MHVRRKYVATIRIPHRLVHIAPPGVVEGAYPCERSLPAGPTVLRIFLEGVGYRGESSWGFRGGDSRILFVPDAGGSASVLRGEVGRGVVGSGYRWSPGRHKHHRKPTRVRSDTPGIRTHRDSRYNVDTDSR
uniref:Uncharacterized protein n=1 Tax=Lygus hesperus TaxID=30085 RepID=A0A146LMP0_LYGHE